MVSRSPTPGTLKVILGGAIAVSCSLTSLDRYFVCDPDHQICRAVAGAGGEAGLTMVDAGGTGDAGGASETAGGGALGGTGADAGASEVAGSGGSVSGTGGGGGTAGAPGAGRGESCMSSQDCAMMLTCYKQICGDALELTYLDTPDVGSVPTMAKWIKFQVFITNRTLNTYAMSRIKVRYYYTEDGVTSEFQVLSTQVPPADITDVTGLFDVSKGWNYLEVGFDANAGNLLGGHTSGMVKVGIHPKDFAAVTFFEPGDYSYVPDTSMSHAAAPNRHVTLYLDSLLVSGEEPQSPPPP
ncbi:MAG TPA: cellulose binding domain-containing protein [Polyangiaceae bacterium]|jgi:hypothetical protein